MMEYETSREDLLSTAKLVFRAAAWVSAIDEKGGGHSQVIERAAIGQNIRKFSMEQDYAPLKPIFATILDSHKAWPDWSRDLSNLTRDLKAIAPGLSLELRQCIYDLSYCVAIRYRERNWLAAFFASIQASLRNFFRPNVMGPDLPDYLNISAVEKSALNELAEILDMPQRLLD